MKPTPVEYLQNVSRILKIPIWIKREDLFSWEGSSGSKARKLHHIIPILQGAGITDIITGGTTGSHHIHSTVTIARKMGIGVHAFVLEQPFSAYANHIYNQTKNLLDTISFTRNELSLSVRGIHLYWKLKKSGKKPYLLLPGGSNTHGICAYLEAGLELENELLEQLDTQICVLGTGGMMAGLDLARCISPNLPNLIGVQVYPGFWNTKSYIRLLSKFAKRKYNIKNYQKEGFSILSNYIGKGYGTIHPRYQEAKEIFQEDGILLEPIYSARMALAAIDYAKSIKNGKGLLLWYTPPKLDSNSLD